MVVMVVNVVNTNLIFNTDNVLNTANVFNTAELYAYKQDGTVHVFFCHTHKKKTPKN